MALFASGYHARNYAYGWWSGHSGGNYRGGTAANGAYVRSLKDRPKSSFIRDAVLAFNTAHHMDGAEITIDPAAKDYM